MTRAAEITRDIERTASRFLEATRADQRHLRIRLTRLYAERDALTPVESQKEIA